MIRKIISVHKGRETTDGAGVKLFRVFSNQEIPKFDPFLLFDNFGSDKPEEYIKGFPWHPHRGIETVTYMLTGEVEHKDSMGNKGTINSGDLQWMTAGSGIIHQEMPKRYKGLMQGFQLWVNLPKSKKMMEPRYREILSKEVPVIDKDGASVKIISGKLDDKIGPVKDLIVDVEYFDITLTAGKKYTIKTKKDYNAFIYVVKGSIQIQEQFFNDKTCILFSDGDSIEVKAKDTTHFLYVSGKKLNEPIVWGGPIVMNTTKELQIAFDELEEGTFIKDKKKK